MNDIISKGDLVEYHGQRLRVSSDPYMFSGEMCVIAMTVEKKKADQRGGIYAVKSLELVKGDLDA